MFNWIRKYFMQEEVSTKEQPIPVVVEPVKKDISEPIISFVETVKNNRKRFKVSSKRFITQYYLHGGHERKTDYSVEDIRTKEVYSVEEIEESKYSYSLPMRISKTYKLTSTDVQWCTQDELEYVITELTKFYTRLYHRKNKRYNQIQFRRTRDMNILKEKERSRLMGIYCEDKANEN